jgi:hypothetical protein
MNQDSDLFLNLWLSLKPYISKKEIGEAAMAYVRQAEEFIDIEFVMQEIKGEDRHLDAAFKEMYPEDGEEEFLDDDDSGYDDLGYGDEPDYD